MTQVLGTRPYSSTLATLPSGPMIQYAELYPSPGFKAVNQMRCSWRTIVVRTGMRPGKRLYYQLFYCTFKSEKLGGFLKEHTEK